MKTIAAKIDALIKANLALHVARTAPVSPHRAQITAHHQSEVVRFQTELTATLNGIFYPPS
jgi:hypothetical protein